MQLLDELLKFVGATGCSDLRRVAAVMNFVKIPNVPGDESIDRILTHKEVLLLCREFHKSKSFHISSTLTFTPSSITIGLPHSRLVSPDHLLVASRPIFPPKPDTGLAKSR